ncbi:MAG TPA: hypothetical protein VIK97_03780 [Casimicrobiaceae bacterium]
MPLADFAATCPRAYARNLSHLLHAASAHLLLGVGFAVVQRSNAGTVAL